MSVVRPDPGALLVYGAGANQLPVIEACRRRGWRTVAIDRDPAAPGAALADRFLCTSLREDDAIRRGVEGERLAGVVARVSDREALASACALARDRGLTAPCADLFEAATSKRALAAHAARAGLDTPPRLDPREAIDFGHGAVVVRPDVSVRGKLAIARVAEAGELAAALTAARAASANGAVDVSRWIDGADVSLLVRLEDGRARALAIWDEWVAFDGGGRIQGVGVGMPASFRASRPSIARVIDALPRAFPQSRGLIALSLRVDRADRAWLIEIHLGIGGDGIADLLLPAALPGWDAFGLLVATQAGEADATLPSGTGARPRPRALLRADDGWALVAERTPERLRRVCASTLPGDWERPWALRESTDRAR